MSEIYKWNRWAAPHWWLSLKRWVNNQSEKFEGVLLIAILIGVFLIFSVINSHLRTLIAYAGGLFVLQFLVLCNEELRAFSNSTQEKCNLEQWVARLPENQGPLEFWQKIAVRRFRQTAFRLQIYGLTCFASGAYSLVLWYQHTAWISRYWSFYRENPEFAASAEEVGHHLTFHGIFVLAFFALVICLVLRAILRVGHEVQEPGISSSKKRVLAWEFGLGVFWFLVLAIEAVLHLELL
jgi:hypothetical protein